MKFAILSSGSKQNCFYVEAFDTAILIDIGISYNKLCNFLSGIGGDHRKIQALFITHEHQDHVAGIRSFAKNTDVPVFMHEKCRKEIPFRYQQWQPLVEKAVKIGPIEVRPFLVNHDAVNTFGFKITSGGKSLFLASDMGSFSDKTIAIGRGCSAIAVESNYDVDMLAKSWYPDHLKKRIFGKFGHLSNAGALEFVRKTITGKTGHVFFLHLSENNNSPEIVEKIIREELRPHYPKIHFHISHRKEPSGLFEFI